MHCFLIAFFFCVTNNLFSQDSLNSTLTGFAKYNQIPKEDDTNASIAKASAIMADQEKDPDKKAFWLYYALIHDPNSKDSDFIELIKKYPNAVFPKESYFNDMKDDRRDLERFIVAEQRMEPSIYLEMADKKAEGFVNCPVWHGRYEKYNLADIKPLEKDYLKVIELCKNNHFISYDGVPLDVVAYAYLFNIENGIEPDDETCSLCDKILVETPDIEYTITKWGEVGYLHYETLWFKIINCSTTEEKETLFKKILLSDDIHQGHWEHAQGGIDYYSSSIGLLKILKINDLTQILPHLINDEKIDNEAKSLFCIYLANIESSKGNTDLSHQRNKKSQLLYDDNKKVPNGKKNWFDNYKNDLMPEDFGN